MARTDLKITLKDASNEEIDRTLSFINPQISNAVAQSIATAYANLSASIYQSATRIITMDVAEKYDPSAQTQNEVNNNG